MFKKITRKRLEQFLARHASEERVLDIGSGGSSYHKYFPNRLTIDIDPNRKPDIVADAENLPFSDEEFKLIICTEVFEHIKNPFKGQEEIWRVLKKGGRLILTTRFIYPLHDVPQDYWRFTKYGLLNLFKDWEIIELKEETDTFSTLAVLFQRISFQTELKANKFTKIAILIFTKIFEHLNWLIKREYGDIKRSVRERSILASGYYMIVQKK